MRITMTLIAVLGHPAALLAQQNATQLRLPAPAAAPVATAVRAAPRT